MCFVNAARAGTFEYGHVRWAGAPQCTRALATLSTCHPTQLLDCQWFKPKNKTHFPRLSASTVLFPSLIGLGTLAMNWSHGAVPQSSVGFLLLAPNSSIAKLTRMAPQSASIFSTTGSLKNHDMLHDTPTVVVARVDAGFLTTGKRSRATATCPGGFRCLWPRSPDSSGSLSRCSSGGALSLATFCEPGSASPEAASG